MRELRTYTRYFMHILESVPNPKILIPGIGLTLTLGSEQSMILLLLALFAVDYFTGVLASWVEWKKLKSGIRFRKEGFTSEKTRLSVVKIVTYFLFILLSYSIESVFAIHPFIFSWTDVSVTITLGATAISCCIEFYSIFFENLPRAGFSIWDKFKKITGTAKSAVDEIKNITKNDGNTPS